MPRRTSTTGSELFIVDNSDEDWKVLRYLHDWCQLSKAIDVATGYFEIGALLALEDEWQKVDQIRVLMGNEVSLRTKAAFANGLQQVKSRLDTSLEREKEKNDFLTGVPAIVEGISSGKIRCRVYRKDKFHAKAYITHGRQEVVGSFGLVGSSNLTYPGITENIELNVQIAGTPVRVLQEWYEEHWDEAEDVTEEILRVVERHIREYSPFEVFVLPLSEFCRGHELTANEWELAGAANGGSRMYAVLDVYQQEGYHVVIQIARRYGGAFLCDGVGLGKTFIALMIIERLVIHEGKRVVLLVPKTARADVWERALREYLPHVGGTGVGDFSSLVILNHTDLGRGGDFPDRIQRVKELADAIVIDGPRGRKELYMLTATPVNNTLHDFRNMAQLFTGQDDNYFATSLGIHSLRRHFVDMERDLVKATTGGTEPGETNLAEAERVLADDRVFRELVVQRSRTYVKKSQQQQGATMALFPVREPPRVAEYSIKDTYERLLDLVEAAFRKEKPLFTLGIYYPLAYYQGPDSKVDPFAENRQKQVCGLIRTQFLKRFESSAHSFEQSCNRLLIKLLAWAQRHSETDGEKRRLDQWKTRHSELTGFVYQRQLELWGDEDEEEADEDLITDEMLEAVPYLDRERYNVEEIMADTFGDLDQIALFLGELRKFQLKHDDKLRALIKLLRTDSVLKKYKVLIFSEFAETARYLHRQLIDVGIKGVEQIDSGSKKNRAEIIRRFAPYYNGSSSSAIAERGESEIRVLISTDVLSEGLNLQDATRLINYDLHWNPVRLMQRIGRVDRRMNPQVEDRLLADHPNQRTLRGKVAYWNFLPPDELNALLSLYNRVSQKTLKISKTFGIEGQKLLTPDDDYEALKDFNHAYEGQTTVDEDMRLELQRLLGDDPTLADRLEALPGRVFSGKQHPTPGTQAVFLCYRLPRPDFSAGKVNGDFPWTEQAAETRWYLYHLASDKILEDPADMLAAIRCTPDTPRQCVIEQTTLSSVRAKVEKRIKNTFLKRMQAPVGVKPILKAWMELN